MTSNHGRRPVRGFSILELIIVVAITLVVSAVAIPQVIAASQNFKLRSTASSLSGVIQKCRMLAVARNGRYRVVAVTSSNVTSVFVDLNASGTLDQTDENTNTLQLLAGMAIDSSGSHPSETSIAGGLTAVNALPQFNPRGLPCFLSSGVCNVDPSKIYISYLRQDLPGGGTGWAAVTVFPAGRAQVWTWDGSNWE